MTAYWLAAERAREAARPGRLFDDPLAQVLAGTEGVDLMTRMEADLPVNPTIPIRTRFFDDALAHVLGERRIGQVVLLAAGMDTRAYRWPTSAGGRCSTPPAWRRGFSGWPTTASRVLASAPTT